MLKTVILSGGSGSRLWPLSREHLPKQLLPLVTDATLLQETVTRGQAITVDLNSANPLIIANEEHRFLVAEQLRQIAVEASSILLEPFGRNTAPALTLAALALNQGEDDPVMLVLPADHVVENTQAYAATVEQGYALAKSGKLVTFGVVPTAAETGYGYIKKGDQVSTDSSGFVIDAFVEKPNQDKAESYLASGDYLWNSGMFMVKTSVWLTEIKRLSPAIYEACFDAFQHGSADHDFFRIESAAFEKCPSDSIDYAVMEKLDKGQAVVVPLDAGWSDVGAWPALWEISGHDQAGNLLKGDVMLHNTSDSLVIADHRLVATVGLKDTIVVETADAVLVADKDSAQQVKEIVNQLKLQGRGESMVHRKAYRPWGWYEGIDAGERYQVKHIVVNPEGKLSLQMHHHRAEHWIVVKGTAKVTCGEKTVLLTENESTYIPLGTKHRLENPGAIPLELVEVQSGSYLGEDDIVRFDDHYGRGEGL